LSYILVNRQTGERAYRGYWKCEDHSGHRHVPTAAYETEEIIVALFVRDDSGQAFSAGKWQPQAISAIEQVELRHKVPLYIVEYGRHWMLHQIMDSGTVSFDVWGGQAQAPRLRQLTPTALRLNGAVFDMIDGIAPQA
jgi:hypothetical protein